MSGADLILRLRQDCDAKTWDNVKAMRFIARKGSEMVILSLLVGEVGFVIMVHLNSSMPAYIR